MSEVIWYHSDEAGAPSLNNTAGSLVALLDALLVNGFNVKSCTITVASGVATVTAAAHGYEAGKKVLIAGATPAGLNGVKAILGVGTNTFTFAAPGVADGSASGTITSRRAPLGWAIQYTGTNRRIYKRTEVTASAQMLRVDDRGSSPASATSARVYAVETATAIDTVGARFPTNTQVPNGFYWFKGVNTGTVKPWTLVGDGSVFYLSLGDYTASEWGNENYSRGTYFFGDVNSYKSSDAYRCVINGSAQDNAGAEYFSTSGATSVGSSPLGSQYAHVARSHLGTGTAQEISLHAFGLSGGGLSQSGMPLAPSPLDGQVQLQQPVCLSNSVASASPPYPVRGEFRGLASLMHSNVNGYFTNRMVIDSLTGTAKAFLVLIVGSGQGLWALDITGPWD